MRAVVQRVLESSVSVAGQTVGSIGKGLLVLIGVESTDELHDADYMVNKISGLRIFEDQESKMNLSVSDIEGELLVVSQFTLLGDARKGKRPSFVSAAEPEKGKTMYEYVVTKLRSLGITTQTGQFRANMQVHLVNDGPVTLLLDSKKQF